MSTMYTPVIEKITHNKLKKFSKKEPCVVCKTSKKVTKDHIPPKWLYKKFSDRCSIRCTVPVCSDCRSFDNEDLLELLINTDKKIDDIIRGTRAGATWAKEQAQYILQNKYIVECQEGIAIPVYPEDLTRHFTRVVAGSRYLMSAYVDRSVNSRCFVVLKSQLVEHMKFKLYEYSSVYSAKMLELQIGNMFSIMFLDMSNLRENNVFWILSFGAKDILVIEKLDI